MSNNYILKAEDVRKSYRMGLTEVKVLAGVELSVKKGGFLSIIGASGSGKSTLLHILGALDRPDAGSVSFKGRDLSGFSAREINKFRNKHVGFVFQFYHLLDELNILENVFLPAMASVGIFGWLRCRNSAKKRAKELLERFGLGHRLKHRPFELSGGERQRAAIARALMNDPQILLADEPTGNLDWQTGCDILKVFEELNRAGQTIIMVTHDQRIAQKAQKILTLAEGKIIYP